MSVPENSVSVRTEGGMALSGTLVPRNLIEVKELATFLSASDLIPKSLGGRKENVAMVLLMGHEIGCGGVAALRNIYVVNGRPCIYGDLATALVRKSGLCESLDYHFEGEGSSLKCVATGKRKGDAKPHTEEFSWADAMSGGLVDKNPTYKKHPKDMIMWKALHRLFKFLWPDVLHGISIRETIMDEVEEADVVGSVEIISEPAAPAPAPEKKPTAKKATVITDEELKAKAEAARAEKARMEAEEEAKVKAVAEAEAVAKRIAAEEAQRKAEAEAKAKAEADKAEEPIEAEAEVISTDSKVNPDPNEVRVIGTLVTAVKLAKHNLFAAKVLTSEGEKRYAFKDYESAVGAKAFQNKSVTLILKPLPTAVEDIAHEIVSCVAVSA